MKCQTLKYDKFETFLKDISPMGDLYESGVFENYIFRGQSNSHWKLLPSILRLSQQEFLRYMNIDYVVDPIEEYYQIQCEFSLLKKFYMTANEQGLNVPYSSLFLRSAFDNFNIGLNNIKEFNWYSEEIASIAALAQHYGLPTRLLDWSKNIYAALYFACINDIMESYNEGNLYRFENDDAFSVWMLNANIFENASHFHKEFCPLKIVELPYYSNPNMKAQKGIFTYWELRADNIHDLGSQVDRESLDDKIMRFDFKEEKSVMMYKIDIGKREVPKTMEYISRLGVNAASLFPGFGGITRKVKEDMAVDYCCYKLYH